MSRNGSQPAEPNSQRDEASLQPPFVQALALGLDPAWRRLDDPDRAADAAAFLDAARAAAADGVGGASYSSIGLEPGTDLLLWRTAASVDDLERSAARLLRSGLGRWL